MQPKTLPEDSERLARIKPKQYGCDDIGAAERLVQAHGDCIRYVAERGRWYCWNGKHWTEDTTGFVQRCAKQCARGIYAEAAEAETDARGRELAAYAGKTAQKSRLDAMISLAASEAGMTVSLERFDSDPMLLCCETGVVDLRRGELWAHDRQHYLSKFAPTKYDPKATCPTWDAFLGRIFAGDSALIDFIRRALGYSLTGQVGERCLFVCWGTGANGKTTLLETVAQIMGDYAHALSAVSLLARRSDGGASPEIAGLKGRRFVVSSETGEGRRFDEERLKLLTGADTITARHLYGEPFAFRMVGKLWLATNHKPEVRGQDEAIWDRIRFIPFSVRIPEGEREKDLGKRLLRERVGILAWLVRGCLEWQEKGLDPPAVVTEATAEYRSEMDIVGDFIDECCVVDSIADCWASSLYRAFREWAIDAGLRPMKQTAFGRRLTEKGFGSDKVGGRIQRLGIRLRPVEVAQQ